MAMLSEHQKPFEATASRYNLDVEFAEAQAEPQAPLFQPLDSTGSHLAVLTATTCVRLDWEELQCFEVVNEQFRSWGVKFSNAIALQPSNPAFPARSGKMVVMGSPKEGWVEARFDVPVKFVTGFITSSRRAVLTAYDDQDQPVGKVESPSPNLAGSGSAISPNVQLSLQASNIRRILIRAFDGQLTLDDFGFSY